MIPSASLTDRLFDDSDTAPLDPFDLFEDWFATAKIEEINDPNAMTLATVDADGLPDARAVLMNGRDRKGFIFYTNFNSAKAVQLLAHPKAALLFHWKSLRRQVRIRGAVERVTDQEADAYFATRARGSQVGAHASNQSHPLNSRQELVDRVRGLEERFAGANVPRPAHWSGFRIIPQEIEFWQDGAYRLHDRVLFVREGANWSRQRLNP